jgi:hypothetical protein
MVGQVVKVPPQFFQWQELALDRVDHPRRQVLQGRLVAGLVQPEAAVVPAPQRHGHLVIGAGQGQVAVLLGGLGQVVDHIGQTAGALVEAAGTFAHA